MRSQGNRFAAACGVSLAVLGAANTTERIAGAVQAPPPTQQPGFYAVTNLGTLCVPTPNRSCAEAGSRAFAVNNWGQVVGISHRAGGEPPLASLFLRGFRTGANQPINPSADAIGFGGIDRNFWAYGINDAGLVVGGYQSLFNVLSPYVADLSYEVPSPETAFVAPPNGPLVTLLAVLNCPTGGPQPFGCEQSVAYAVNNAGTIVGRAAPSATNSPSRAFRLAGTTIQDLGTLSGLNGSMARHISDSGSPVGLSYFTGFISIFRAVRFNNSGPVELDSQRPDSEAYGVNSAGQIVGWFLEGQAFFYDPTVAVAPGGSSMQGLGTLCSNSAPCTSSAFGINDSGEIVGESQVASGSPATHAFLFRVQEGVMRDLNDLIGSANQASWVLTDARALNDLGQIVGTGLFNGQTRAYLLTPPLSIILENMNALLSAIFDGPQLGLAESLLSKLNAAKSAIDRGDLEAAGVQLDGYEREVQALVRSRQITSVQGAKLLAGAALIRRETRR